MGWMTTNSFRRLFVASLVVAVIAFGAPWLVNPGSTDTAIKVSALLAFVWWLLVVSAFLKFRQHALWFLIGTPLVGFWFFVLFWIASKCAHDLKSCP